MHLASGVCTPRPAGLYIHLGTSGQTAYSCLILHTLAIHSRCNSAFFFLSPRRIDLSFFSPSLYSLRGTRLPVFVHLHIRLSHLLNVLPLFIFSSPVFIKDDVFLVKVTSSFLLLYLHLYCSLVVVGLHCMLFILYC